MPYRLQVHHLCWCDGLAVRCGGRWTYSSKSVFDSVGGLTVRRTSRIGRLVSVVKGESFTSPRLQEVHPSSCIHDGPVRSKSVTDLLKALLLAFFGLKSYLKQGGLQPVVGRL